MPAALLPEQVVGLKAITFFPATRGRSSTRTREPSCSSRRSAGGCSPSSTRPRSPRSARPPRAASRRGSCAREDAGDLAIIGSGVQARTHLEAMTVARHAPPRARREQGHGPGEGLRRAANRRKHGIAVEAGRTSAGGRRRRRHHLHRRRPRASPSSSASGSRPARTSTRSGSSVPTARELDTAAGRAIAPLRRPPRVGAERSRRLPDPEEGGRDRRRPHRRRDRRAPDRARAGDGSRRTRSRSSSRSASPSRTSRRRGCIYEKAEAIGDRTIPGFRRSRHAND